MQTNKEVQTVEEVLGKFFQIFNLENYSIFWVDLRRLETSLSRKSAKNGKNQHLLFNRHRSKEIDLNAFVMRLIHRVHHFWHIG